MNKKDESIEEEKFVDTSPKVINLQQVHADMVNEPEPDFVLERAQIIRNDENTTP